VKTPWQVSPVVAVDYWWFLIECANVPAILPSYRYVETLVMAVMVLPHCSNLLHEKGAISFSEHTLHTMQIEPACCSHEIRMGKLRYGLEACLRAKQGSTRTKYRFDLVRSRSTV
jgi:hypothetical protein